jgi:hypothetical protein
MKGADLMKIRRLALPALLAVPGLLAAPAASAAQPEITTVPADSTQVDESCGFPVEVVTTGFIVTKEWEDEDGSVRRLESFPQLKATFTNLETGESARVVASGPSRIVEGPDRSFSFAGSGIWWFPQNFETGEVGLVNLTGRLVFELDADGNVFVNIVGHSVDLCAALAE